jgi:hypothetical protein
MFNTGVTPTLQPQARYHFVSGHKISKKILEITMFSEPFSFSSAVDTRSPTRLARIATTSLEDNQIVGHVLRSIVTQSTQAESISPFFRFLEASLVVSCPFTSSMTEN